MRAMKKILFLTIINLFSVCCGMERIVSLSPALTELVCILGCEKQLAGRSDVCNFPASITDVPIAGRFADPYIERIIDLNPTLIITNDLINPNIRATFEKYGIRTEIIPCRNIAEYRSCVEKLGSILNAEAKADAELERIDNFLKNLPGKQTLKVVWVIWDSPLMVAGKNSLPDEVIRLAGAVNVAANVPQPYFKCSYDWLLEQKIDVIIWSASPNGWKHRSFWQKLDAVRKNKIIHSLDPDLIQRPGPRIFDGIMLLRKTLEKM